MADRLTPNAKERSTYAVHASFLDENGDAATLRDITWSLVRRDGTTVNGRSEVAVTGTASSITIVLTGDDLRRWVADSGVRRLTVQGVYDSALGNNLSHTDEVEFVVDGLTGIASEV